MRISLKILLTIWFLSANGGAGNQTDEYTLKAVAFEQVSRFIKWPNNSLTDDTNQPFTIVILGDDPFKGKIEKLYSNRNIKNKNVKTIYIDKITDFKSGHVLFISKSEKKEIENVVKYTKEKSVLVVGDTKGYANSGVHLNFLAINNKIKFEINKKEMLNAGFEVSYLLTRVSKIVDSN